MNTCQYNKCVWCHDQPLLIQIEEVYLGTGVKEAGIEDLVNPKVKPVPMFKGFVVEPGYQYINVWQFKIVDDKIYGRPSGGSRSRRVFDVEKNVYRRRKRGEWFEISWLPQEAVDNINLVIKKLL